MTLLAFHRKRQSTGDSGVAAIEFALVFPVLLLLFFGMINLTHFAYMKRQIATAAELTSDLVARSQKTIEASKIDDYFSAVELAFRPMARARVQANIGVDVYGYPSNTGTARQRWSRFYGGTARCTPPDVASFTNLLADSDVVVAVVCMNNYTAPAANFPGLQFLDNLRIERSFALRPRDFSTLDCSGCE